MIELFSLSLQVKKLVGGFIPLDVGASLKSQFQLLEHLICSATFQKMSSLPQFINRLTLRTELSRSHQNVYVRCSQHPQTTLEVQHTERYFKDISLLCSNEDNPQYTDPVRIIATINFQLNFSRNISKIVELKRKLRHNLQSPFDYVHDN